ncbi:MAG: site-specific integrase [Candidatus Nitrosotenuis sp.]|nr:site-specific integrase [Candidatus Nitrosotenuis sp.]
MQDFEEQALVEANELTEEQYQAFLGMMEQIPTPRAPITGAAARLLFEFMEDSGCRVTEALHVKKKDIDFRTRILTVTHPKSEKQCPCSRWKYKDLYSRARVLDYADRDCSKCHGKGKYKKPQRTTITPRLAPRLYQYCESLAENDLLWPISRKSVWKWGKRAGEKAGIRIFQQKDNIMIEGIFPHLFRALCSKRTTALAKDDKYKDALVACKMRHSYQVVTDRYTKITINYLVSWESRVYSQAGLLASNPAG